MPKKNYDEIKGLFSETEPPEFRAYGLNGVDLIVNAQQTEGGWTYDVLRFHSKAEFSIYKQLNP